VGVKRSGEGGRPWIMGLPAPLGDVQGEASRRLRGEGKVDLLATVALVVAPIQSSRE